MLTLVIGSGKSVQTMLEKVEGMAVAAVSLLDIPRGMRLRPTVVVLSLQPGDDGVMAIRGCLQCKEPPPVIIVVTTCRDASSTAELRMAGALAVLHYPIATETIRKAVTTFGSWGPLSRDNISYQGVCLDLSTNSIYVRDTQVKADEIEKQAVGFLIANRGTVSTYEAISQFLGVTLTKAKEIMRILRQKLARLGDPIHLVWGRGYIIKEVLPSRPPYLRAVT